MIAAPFVPDPRNPPPAEPTEAQLRYIRAPEPILQLVHDYMLAFWDMDMVVGDDELTRMLDAAEAKILEREGRIPPPRAPRRTAAGAHEPVVYYFRLADLVKIGTSGDIRQRMVSVPCQGVMAVEYGTYDLEAERHQQFISAHQWGEWYRLDETLGRHIADVRERFERAINATTERWLAAPF